MKRFLSLMLVVVMLFAVLAMVGCNGNKDNETTATTPAATTTEKAPDTTTTEPPVTTPDTTTTEPQVTTPDTTTTAPAPDTTTTAKPEETTTTTPGAATEGTTVPIFARFDFGTKSKAQDQGLTSHEYLVENMTLDKNSVAVEYTEDTIVIYAMKDYVSGSDFSIQFLDIVTYDFDGELVPGWGSWNGAPINTANYGVEGQWVGKHQYMKIRILNNTNNNMISMDWRRPTDSAFFTTTTTPFMYLQGGAPTTTSATNKTAEPSKEWKSYVYDVYFLASAGRELTQGKTSYVQIMNEAKNRGSIAFANWYGGNICAIKFHLLGASSSKAAADSRTNIKQGNKVEVDYIIFGSSIEGLNEWHSYLEDSANA